MLYIFKTMHVNEISFCGKVGFNIKSEDTKRKILTKLEDTYGIKVVAKHYDKFHDRMMSGINKNLHLMCSRTNGNPYFLYLVKINFTNYCIFIDKKVQQGYFYPRMIITHLFMDDAMFKEDVVFDGEMVKIEDDKWIYLINDILVHKNKFLTDMNLVKRLNLCHEILDKYYSPMDTDIFRIMVKRYFKYNELADMIEFLKSRPYTSRGIYFKPLYLKFKDILINFDDSLVCKVDRKKLKKDFMLMEDVPTVITQEEDNKSTTSSDGARKFNMKKTSQPDVYELYDGDKYHSLACVPNMALSKHLRVLFADVNLVTKLEVNCDYSEKFKKWYPLFR